LYNGEKEKAAKIFRQITAGNQAISGVMFELLLSVERRIAAPPLLDVIVFQILC